MASSVKLLSDPALGYLSLTLCILTPITIDQAFEKIAPDPEADRKLIRRQEDEDMLKLHEEKISWYAMGQIFGVSPNAAFKRVKRLREKVGINESH